MRKIHHAPTATALVLLASIVPLAGTVLAEPPNTEPMVVETSSSASGSATFEWYVTQTIGTVEPGTYTESGSFAMVMFSNYQGEEGRNAGFWDFEGSIFAATCTWDDEADPPESSYVVDQVSRATADGNECSGSLSITHAAICDVDAAIEATGVTGDMTSHSVVCED